MNAELELNQERKTICETVKIPESITALKHRYLNLSLDRLRTAALLAGCPPCFIETVLDHFRKFNLSKVEGDSFTEWSDNSEVLLLELLRETAAELAKESSELIEQA